MKLLTCQSLVVGYDRHAVTAPLNLSVEEGAYLCVAGRNGCGKSTLIKTIVGLQPALEGSLCWAEGMNARELGYLPQNSVRRDFPATVREVVQSGCLNKAGLRPFYTRAARIRAQLAMERLDVKELAGHSFCQLSGGQQQRVLLARALCASGRVIIMDEPVTGLDPVAMQEMYESVKRLNREEGLTVIMVSHDLQKAVQDATHVLHLDREKPFWGTAQAYQDSELYNAFVQKDMR